MRKLLPEERVIHIPSELLIIKTDSQLDTLPNTSNFRITWTNQNGEERDIQKLDNSHLGNLCRWLARNKLDRTFGILAGEMWRRVQGNYPNDFDELVQEYKAKPEIWRLKIYS